jgi:hypothetical protein
VDAVEAAVEGDRLVGDDPVARVLGGERHRIAAGVAEPAQGGVAHLVTRLRAELEHLDVAGRVVRPGATGVLGAGRLRTVERADPHVVRLGLALDRAEVGEEVVLVVDLPAGRDLGVDPERVVLDVLRSRVAAPRSDGGDRGEQAGAREARRDPHPASFAQIAGNFDQLCKFAVNSL